MKYSTALLLVLPALALAAPPQQAPSQDTTPQGVDNPPQYGGSQPGQHGGSQPGQHGGNQPGKPGHQGGSQAGKPGQPGQHGGSKPGQHGGNQAGKPGHQGGSQPGQHGGGKGQVLAQQPDNDDDNGEKHLEGKKLQKEQHRIKTQFCFACLTAEADKYDFVTLQAICEQYCPPEVSHLNPKVIQWLSGGKPQGGGQKPPVGQPPVSYATQQGDQPPAQGDQPPAQGDKPPEQGDKPPAQGDDNEDTQGGNQGGDQPPQKDDQQGGNQGGSQGGEQPPQY